MTAGVLPADVELVRTTPVFDRDTVPAGLLGAHSIADGVWGRLVVHTGALLFVFEDQPDPGTSVVAGGSIVIPPTCPHRLVIDEPVTFSVEFHRRPAS